MSPALSTPEPKVSSPVKPTLSELRGLRILARLAEREAPRLGRDARRHVEAARRFVDRVDVRMERTNVAIGAEDWRWIDYARSLLPVRMARQGFLRWALARVVEEVEAGRRVDWLPADRVGDERADTILRCPRSLLLRVRRAERRLEVRGLGELVRRAAAAFAFEIVRGHGDHRSYNGLPEIARWETSTGAARRKAGEA